ncbi:protein phosphatase 2C family protein [Actinidia rufa]|uniref:Protein phosphatase 2C family protein n=1 Tax=Actinidia rufa TaxID=165716 RepID=A0A7J0EGX7_9ERIC|nr:protein phosphatase 2C family protein [Actinidia rufa]
MEDFYETRIAEVDGQMVAFFGVFDVESFRQTDADYLIDEKGQQKDAGSTASTAVLLGDRLLVANVGDFRVVACRAGSGWLLHDELPEIVNNLWKVDRIEK